MQITDAKWTPKVNLLKIKCRCGNEFWHRADRKKVKCFRCGHIDYLGPIRKRYRLEKERTNVKVKNMLKMALIGLSSDKEALAKIGREAIDMILAEMDEW